MYSSLEGLTVLPATQNLPQAQELRSLFSWLCGGTSVYPECLRGPKPGSHLNKWRMKFRRVGLLLRMAVWPNHLLPIRGHLAFLLWDFTEFQKPSGFSESSWRLSIISNVLGVHTALFHVSVAWVFLAWQSADSPVEQSHKIIAGFYNYAKKKSGEITTPPKEGHGRGCQDNMYNFTLNVWCFDHCSLSLSGLLLSWRKHLNKYIQFCYSFTAFSCINSPFPNHKMSF